MIVKYRIIMPGYYDGMIDNLREEVIKPNYPFKGEGFCEAADKSAQMCVMVGGGLTSNVVYEGLLVQGSYEMPKRDDWPHDLNPLERDASYLTASLSEKRCFIHQTDENGKSSYKELENLYYDETEVIPSYDRFTGETYPLTIGGDDTCHIEFTYNPYCTKKARMDAIVQKIEEHVKDRDEHDFTKATNGVLYYDENHKLVFDARQDSGQSPEQFRESMKSFVKAMGKDVASFSLDGVEQSVKKEISDVKREKRSRQLDAKWGDMFQDENKYTVDMEIDNMV